MAYYLKLALDDAPRTLISADASKELINIGHKLPPGFSNFLFGFECRLGEESPYVDIAFGLTKNNNTHHLVKDIVEHHLFEAHSRSNGAWKKLKELIEDYSGNDHPLSMWLDNIILEFDHETSVNEHPVPAVFLGINPFIVTGGIEAENGMLVRRYVPGATYRVLVRSLEFLMDNKLSADAKKTLRNCFRHLPQRAYIFQAGAMLSRLNTTAKICVRKITTEGIKSFLEDIHWQGNDKSWDYVMKDVGSTFDRFVLSMDLSDVILTKIGIECYFHQKRQPSQEPRWVGLLDRLIMAGICTPEKGKGLLSFPAREEYFPIHQLDTSTDNTTTKRFPHLMVRGLHHLKFTIEPEKPVSVKAYLYSRIKPIL